MQEQKKKVFTFLEENDKKNFQKSRHHTFINEFFT